MFARFRALSKPDSMTDLGPYLIRDYSCLLTLPFTIKIKVKLNHLSFTLMIFV